MDRYEVREEQGNFFVHDNVTKKLMGIAEATSLLNEATTLEEREDLKEFVNGCNKKLGYDLLDKTLEIIMMPIMEIETDKLVGSVERLSQSGEGSDWACANLLRRAIYLKALAEAG